MLRWRKWSTPVPYQEKISTVSNPQCWAYQHRKGDKHDIGFVPWELALNFWSGSSNLIFFLSTSLHEYFNAWRHKFWICLCIHRFFALSFFHHQWLLLNTSTQKKYMQGYAIYKTTYNLNRANRFYQTLNAISLTFSLKFLCVPEWQIPMSFDQFFISNI